MDVLPVVANVRSFALKGGTAINLFYRDMPRLSVDIDLTWLPIAERTTSLRAIDGALEGIASELVRHNPNFVIRRGGPSDISGTRIVVRRARTQIKIETSPVARGSVLPPSIMEPSEAVTHRFGFVQMNVLSFDDLYAGKLVAALDRQHPRDLFDINVLYRNEGITDSLFRVFLVYLACSRRPIHELLSPSARAMETWNLDEFNGMTEDEVNSETLNETRNRLRADIVSRLRGRFAEFLLSVHDASSNFELIGFPHAAELPAVLWKQSNLERLKQSDPTKHSAQRHALERSFH